MMIRCKIIADDESITWELFKKDDDIEIVETNMKEGHETIIAMTREVWNMMTGAM